VNREASSNQFSARVLEDASLGELVRLQSSTFLLLVIFLFAAFFSAETEAEEGPRGYPMLFHLLPAKHWVAGRLPSGKDFERVMDEMLPEGQVYLYREGEMKPTLVLEANAVGRVPAGKWFWIAEANGYVSSFSGSFMVSDEMEAEPYAEPRVIVWSVVPACRIDLDKERSWKGVQRLDFVSFPYNMVYLLFPGDRDGLWLPVGHNLTYSVDNRGLQGMADLGACRQFEVVTLPPPESPPSGRQDFMVHLVPREDVDVEKLNWDELSVAFETTRKDAVLGPAPTGRLWTGERWTVFFLDVPAAENWNLVARHPNLRSVVAPVEFVEGTAVELPPEELKPRREVRYHVDFKSKRPHGETKILTYYCGRERRPPKEVGQCSVRVRDQELQAGVHEYVLDNLDDGLYWLYAVIDDETLFALGSNVEIFLDPKTDDVPLLPLLPVHEMEIYGNVLVEDEPVEGVVKLIPKIAAPDVSTYRTEFGRARVFPTDKDLLYHMYYFGRIQWFESFPPEEGEGGPVRGLYPGTEILQACSDDGFCRTYNFHSRLAGEGRLDFAVDAGQRLTLGVSEGFRFPTLTLVPDDLLFAFSRTGSYIYFRTDRDGFLSLRNVSPESPVVPEVFTSFAGYTGSVSLSNVFDGYLDLVVE